VQTLDYRFIIKTIYIMQCRKIMKSFIYPRKWVLVRISNFTSLKETIEEISNCIEDNEKHMPLRVIGEDYNFEGNH